MIKTFKHKGLRIFFETGSHSGIKVNHARKLRMQLAALDTSRSLEDMNIPGYRLHPLRGRRSGYWAVDVSGNWRLTFRIDAGDVYEVDYEDYH